MARPRTTGYDCNTGEHIDREMTDEEYEALLASGWTPSEETPTEEPPASDDAGAPSTDAG